MPDRHATDAVTSNVKAKQRPRFDVEALRELAGDKVFARGEDYHRDGQVLILSIRAERVVAQVAGTEDYRTELSGRGRPSLAIVPAQPSSIGASASTWWRRRWRRTRPDRRRKPQAPARSHVFAIICGGKALKSWLI